MSPFTATAPDHYVNHLTQLSEIMETAGWIREVEPNCWALDVDAPESLRDSYWDLVRRGRANGWIV